MENLARDREFDPPAHWAPPTSSTHPNPATAFDPAGQDSVQKPPDVIAAEASPASWLSPRVLSICVVVVGLIVVGTVVGCLLYWLTPPMHPVSVPVVAQG